MLVNQYSFSTLKGKTENYAKLLTFWVLRPIKSVVLMEECAEEIGYMRPTKATPKACDQSPVVLPHIPDVTPLALPEQSLQISNPSMDPPGETNQPGGVDKIVLMNSPGHSRSANRPGRKV